MFVSTKTILSYFIYHMVVSWIGFSDGIRTEQVSLYNITNTDDNIKEITLQKNELSFDF